MRIPMLRRSCLTVLLLASSAAAVAQNAMTADSADLYAGPDDSYPVVAQLDANTPVQVMGCLDDWSWCDVGVDGGRGWLFAQSLSYQYEGGYVPFYSYAPSFGVAVVSFSVNDYWGHYYQGRPFYGQRDNWAHRTIQHRRPPGPPPSRSHPPRPEQRGAPHDAGRPGAVHGGSADPHQDAGRRGADDRNSMRPEQGGGQRPERGGAPRPDIKPAPKPEAHVAPGNPRPEDHARPTTHVTAPPREAHPQPAEHADRPEPPHEDHPH